MACTEKLRAMEIEREEGEIVDELDDLSDISSEEEFLLRQRLQVLENYNNVLERKQAKRSVVVPENKTKTTDLEIQDLSDVSLTNFDEAFQPVKDTREKYVSHHKHKRRKEVINQENVNGSFARDKKKYKVKKKIPPKLVISESSDESDHDERNKRMKLATAISVKKNKTDSSLRTRLMNMLCANNANKNFKSSESKEIKMFDASKEIMIRETQKTLLNNSFKAKTIPLEIKKVPDPVIVLDDSIEAYKVIDSVTDTETKESNVIANVTDYNHMDLAKKSPSHDVSDDDLEKLRNFALQSKTQKAQESKEAVEPEVVKDSKISTDENVITVTKPEEKKDTQIAPPLKLQLQSEDEDSDTSELRLICLRSTLLKKAIEMKRKQKLRKRLSQSISLYDEIIAGDHDDIGTAKDNTTDTESMDMEIGSDHEREKSQDPSKNIIEENESSQEKVEEMVPKSYDLEEDEDLLRAKLLTSLSKNLPLLDEVNNLNESVEDIETNQKANIAAEVEEKTAPQERRFIINTADSDSEGEHEATKNLTKMHMQLSDSVEFQQRLDSFLKSTRQQVESNKKLPDVVQTSDTAPAAIPPKTPEKFIPKAVNHLPKIEQIEYKNLVKRMAELEKMRQARQMVDSGAFAKDMLKPRNVTLDHNKVLPAINVMNSNIEEQIALSRKNIAEESAKVLKLKEEAFKLSQKYKIVATELRNLATAITLNKKSQKTSQIKLSKIRAQHQVLLKRSTTYAKSHANVNVVKRNIERGPAAKIQKENAPLKSGMFDTMLKSVKVSVVNDLQKRVPEDFSVHVDVSSNRKTINVPSQRSPVKADIREKRNIDTGQIEGKEEMEVLCAGSSEYESPLQALESANWTEDPHGVLCPFAVGGSCKDANCNYLHPKSFPDP